MKTEVTDEKLAALIREVQERKKANPTEPTGRWREIIGTSVGDDADREAARLGEEWRRSEGLSD